MVGWMDGGRKGEMGEWSAAPTPVCISLPMHVSLGTEKVKHEGKNTFSLHKMVGALSRKGC